MLPAIERAGILVVDDRAENLLALRAVFDGSDYDVVTATSGLDALKHILKRDFAVILLDVFMPTMDGFETARLIAQREASQKTPIIFLTAAGSDVASIFRGYSVGAVDYLIKPLDANIVRAKVAVFVDLFRKTQLIRYQEEELRHVERKRSELALRDREAEYERTFETAEAGIAHLAPDGRWLRVNRKMSEILGCKREELIGHPFQQMAHPEDVNHQVSMLRGILRGDVDSARRECRFLHHDGHTVWLDTTVSLLRDDAKRPKKFIAVMEDVTIHRLEVEGQRVLATASEILLASFDHEEALPRMAQSIVPTLADWCIVDLTAPEAGFPTDLVVAHVDAEQAARMRAAYPHDAAEGGWGLELVAEERKSLLFSEVSADLLARLTDYPATTELLSESQVRSVLIVPLMLRGLLIGAMTWISNAAGKRYGPLELAFAEDLARRAVLGVENSRLYREAQEAVRVRDEFLSIASHELRTPITPLQIQLQRLLGVRGKPGFEAMSQEQLRNILQRSVGQVGRIATLVSNLLDVTRIHAGRLTLDLEPVDLSTLVRDTVARFAEGMTGCNIHIEAEPGIQAYCDKLRMEQVLTNLVSNACKYGLDKDILVRVEKRGSRGALIVKDSGIGIRPDKVPVIFNRFERAEAARAYAGLGLGLYIARQIVDAHGGTIGVQSQHLEGSTFTVEIPLRASSTRLKTLDQEQTTTSPRLTISRTVLVIEDDDDIGESMRDLLQSHGHIVVMAKNGQQALQILATEPSPDVILLDLMMPVMDGYEFRVQQQKLPRAAEIPVVLVSGDGNLSDRAREMAAAGYLRKPPTAQELLGVVESLA